LVDRAHEQNVYLQDQHRDGCLIKPGDLVLVYEYKSGPTLVLPETGQRIKRARGHEGVILAGEVVSDFRRRPPDLARQEYEERDSMSWGWEAEVKPLSRGLVPRVEVNRILGFAEGHRFFGFNHGKGYQRVTRGQFDNLHQRVEPVRASNRSAVPD
jgi:hypothetical protein